MQIIEYEKLDELINEYINKRIPLSILISEYNVSYKQINYIIKTVKENQHIKETNTYTKEDYINIIKHIENINEELKNNNLPYTQKVKLEFDRDSSIEKIIREAKSIFDDTVNMFFNDIDLSEDIYSYCNEALAEVLNNYNSNSRVNFIALLTSKIIKTIEANFKEIKGMSFEEYKDYNTKGIMDIPEIIDIDMMLDNNLSNDISEDDESIEGYEELEDKYFISKDNVEEETVNNLSKETLEKVVDTLPQDEAQIIKLRYGLSGNEMHSFAEIAKKLNITTEMVRNREYNALRRLRHPERLRKIYDSPNKSQNISKQKSTLSDRIYLQLINLLIHNCDTETLIKLINLEGANWEMEDYINAKINLSNIFKRISNLKFKMDKLSVCNTINKETNYLFSMPFIEKLVTEYSLNKNLINKLNEDSNEMKL